MNIEIKIAEASDFEKWNEIVEESNHGTIFHRFEWLQIVENHTKSKLYPLIAYDKDRIIGIFPIFLQRKGGLKLVFSPPPKCDIPYLGPVLRDYEDIKQVKKEDLFHEFIAQIDSFIFKEIKPDFLQFVLHPHLLDARPFRWKGYEVIPEYTYILKLNKGIDLLWSELQKRLRTEISKANRSGLVVKNGTKEDLFEIFNSSVERFREQNIIYPLSKEHFIDLNNIFPKNMEVFTVSENDRNLGGIIALNYKKVSMLWLGRYKIDHPSISVNDYLQWEYIRWLCENDFELFDMVGANVPRLSHYKVKYNPDLEMFLRVKKRTLSGFLAEKLYENIIRAMKNDTFQ